MRHIIVGGGGVGSFVLPVLCRYLNFDTATVSPHEVLIIDKDRFEPRNKKRQHFTGTGGKAEVLVEMYQALFPQILFEAHAVYLNDDNIYGYVGEGDMVFCCVDNHASRKVLTEYVETLRDATLISGGNEYHDGNVQVHCRRAGETILPMLSYLHPEIGSPTDVHPDNLTCEDRAAEGSPQLIFANATVATLMCNAYWCITSCGNLPYSEAYFDLKNGVVRPVLRQPAQFQGGNK